MSENERPAGHFEVWADDPDYPSSDWRAEVANEETRRGYWEWVAVQREFDELEEGA